MEEQEDPLFIWTVYVKGPPFPDMFSARKWEVGKGEVIDTEQVLCSPNLEEIRMKLKAQGLVPLPRAPEDDQSIIESWI